MEVEDAERSVEKGDKKPGNKGENRMGTERDKLEPKIMYEEGFWPVGVRWKPFSQRTNRKPPPVRQPDVSIFSWFGARTPGSLLFGFSYSCFPSTPYRGSKDLLFHLVYWFTACSWDVDKATFFFPY